MKRPFRLAALVMLVSLAVAACAKTPTPNTQKPSITSLRVGAFVTEAGSKNPEPDPVMDALIAAFQEQHKDVRVEKYPIDVVNEMAFNSMQMAIQQEKVDLLPLGWISSMVQKKLVEPLDPYLQKETLDWKPLGDIADLKVDGALYQLPFRLTPMVIRYNADLLKASGQKAPEGDWTWDQFRELSKKLTTGSGSSKVWGFETPVPGYLLNLYLRQSTPDTKWRYNEAAMEKGLRLFAEMISLDQSMPPLSRETDINGRPVTDPAAGWSGGKAVMTLGGLSSVRPSDGPFPIGVLPMPTVAGAKPYVYARYSSLSMASTSTRKDLAWEFLKFCTSPEGAVILAKNGALPAYRTREAMDLWLGQDPTPAMRTIAAAPSRLFSEETSTADQIAQGAYENAFITTFDGTATWEAAFKAWRGRVKGAR